MKVSKQFRGVPDGEIYPVTYEPGDEVPPELEAAARALGCAGGDDQPVPAAKKKAKD